MRRPRAATQSHRTPSDMSSPVASRLAYPSSPLANKSLPLDLSITATPPQNRALAKQLKLKGSYTDPPRPRKREAFGIVSHPQAMPRVHTLTHLLTADSSSFSLPECQLKHGPLRHR
jgi:hypothetical protein